jgi:hypothetical protein
MQCLLGFASPFAALLLFRFGVGKDKVGGFVPSASGRAKRMTSLLTKEKRTTLFALRMSVTDPKQTTTAQ